METLLVAAIIMISLSIIVQAGVLLAMYLKARKLSNQVSELVADSRKLVPPLETAAANLKTVSGDFREIGKAAREQIEEMQFLVMETRDAATAEIENLRCRFHEILDETSGTLLAPLRQWNAVVSGVKEGLRVFFRRGTKRTGPADEHVPAA